MLKEETHAHWYKAANILEQVKNGTSVFLAGDEMFTKPLPQRLVALYAYFTNFDIIEDWENYKVSLGGKLPFLVMQSLLYYISLYFLYSQISKYFNHIVCLSIVIFFVFRAYNNSISFVFLDRIIFLSLQIILLSMILKMIKLKLIFLS